MNVLWRRKEFISITVMLSTDSIFHLSNLQLGIINPQENSPLERSEST
jgi:hypothetical protein